MTVGRPPGRSAEAYVDANVVLAFLAGADHPHHGAAAALMERVDKGNLRLLVEPIIVAEAIWASRRALGRSSADMASSLRRLIASDGIVTSDKVVMEHALDLQVEHPRMDFADAWLAARALVTGPPLVASFDRDLDLVPGVERVGATSEPVPVDAATDEPERPAEDAPTPRSDNAHPDDPPGP